MASLVLTQFWLLYLFFGLLLRRSKEEEQEKEAAEKIKHATAAASEQSVKKTPKGEFLRYAIQRGMTCYTTLFTGSRLVICFWLLVIIKYLSFFV